VCNLSILNSLNLVLFVVCWYKQPIVSVKQPIVFLVLLFLIVVFGKLNFLSIVSRDNFIIVLKVYENPL